MTKSEFLALITTISLTVLTVKFPLEVFLVVIGLVAIFWASYVLNWLFDKLAKIYDYFL
jgi:hypothetical protein